MPTASRQKASRLLCCSSSFISACAVLSPTAASITGPTLNADPIAGSRRPIIVPMQQSRKSSICSPPLDAGLPLLESFSQTSAGLESIIVPMQQSRKSSICSPPLDAGLPLLESFSQTSAGLESIIVPMQQSRKSSICSPPLDAGLPLLESFSQTS